MLLELSELLDENRVLVLIALACAVWLVHRALSLRASVARARAFEESRREIAAYLAEGSITPETAQLLLSHAPVDAKGEGGAAPAQDAGKSLAEAVSWGCLGKKTAGKLVAARQGMTEQAWADAVKLTIDGMPVDDAIALARARSGPAASPIPAGNAIPAGA